MKKTMLAILAALLLFTTACAGGGGDATTVATVAPTVTTTATTAATTAAAAANSTPVSEITNLISDGYPTDHTYFADTDYPHAGSKQMVFAEKENRYYFLAEQVLVSADADTMDVFPMCSRDGCTHISTSCEARATGSYSELFYHNGRIYAVEIEKDSYEIRDEENGYMWGGTCTLTSFAPDGTDRRVDYSFDLGTDARTTSICGIHRGKFYYSRFIPDDNAKTMGELWVYDLDTPNVEAQCVYRTEIDNWSWSLSIYGNYLYLSAEQCHIRNLITGEWTVADFNTNAPEGYQFSKLSFVDDELLVTYASIEDIDNVNTAYEAYLSDDDAAGYTPSPIRKQVYRSTPDASTLQYLGEYTGPVPFDGSYAFVSESFTSQYGYKGIYDRVNIYDQTFNIVDTINCKTVIGDVILQGGNWSVLYAAGDKIILTVDLWVEPEENDASHKNPHALFYVDYRDIGSNNIQPVEFFRYESGDYTIG